MPEELHLVKDLAIILISAGLFTIIFKALKQPLILGYLIAGFFIGPHFSFYFGITDPETVNQWSEIGMIFLMFALGLEFSVKKLIKVGSAALLTAGVKFIGVFIIGFVTGKALSWSFMESVFLGGLLSMSSTMVIIKAYNDMGLKNKPYSGVVFGTLVVEDLIAILLMVLLSTMAVTKSFAGKELMMNIAKLVFFLILWFLVGIFVIPTVLKKAKKYLNEEILLIVSLGFCFGMVSLATAVGFSSALGAFVMGSILAETIESEHILKIVEPIKDLFGAIFFVSVGMMIAPDVIFEHWAIILLISIIVIVGTIVFAGGGAILAGKGLNDSVQIGFSLAQLGEFGFILAGLGCTLGVMRDFIYPVIIAVTVLTTFTTPFMIKLGEGFYPFLVRKLPEKWLERLDHPEDNSKNTAAEENEWKILIKAYVTRILLYGVIIIAIYIGSKVYLAPLMEKFLPSSISTFTRNLLTVTITLVVMAPFLYGLGISPGSISSSAPKLLKQKRSNVWPIIGLIVTRAFIAIGIVLGIVSTYFNLAGWSIVAIAVAGTIFILITRRSIHHLSAFETMFLLNYNEKEEIEKRSQPIASSVKETLSSFDIHTEAILITPDSKFTGKKLKEVPLRSETGSNIIKLTRGSRSFIVPDGDIVIFPQDKIIAIGTTEQLNKSKELMNMPMDEADYQDDNKDFKIKVYSLKDDSMIVGQSLRNLLLRKYKCMVVSVLRDGNMLTNPEPDFVFKSGDSVWIAGLTEQLGWD